MRIAKKTFHPRAFLNRTRNVKRGLASRTGILVVLEAETCTAKALSEEIKLGYNAVLHHLHLLESERIVSRSTTQRRPYIWELTGAGQQRLESA
jgi:predicted ArsR family transcriptional regulator